MPESYQAWILIPLHPLQAGALSALRCELTLRNQEWNMLKCVVHWGHVIGDGVAQTQRIGMTRLLSSLAPGLSLVVHQLGHSGAGSSCSAKWNSTRASSERRDPLHKRAVDRALYDRRLFSMSQVRRRRLQGFPVDPFLHWPEAG